MFSFFTGLIGKGDASDGLGAGPALHVPTDGGAAEAGGDAPGAFREIFARLSERSTEAPTPGVPPVAEGGNDAPAIDALLPDELRQAGLNELDLEGLDPRAFGEILRSLTASNLPERGAETAKSAELRRFLSDHGISPSWGEDRPMTVAAAPRAGREATPGLARTDLPAPSATAPEDRESTSVVQTVSSIGLDPAVDAKLNLPLATGKAESSPQRPPMIAVPAGEAMPPSLAEVAHTADIDRTEPLLDQRGSGPDSARAGGLVRTQPTTGEPHLPLPIDTGQAGLRGGPEVATGRLDPAGTAPPDRGHRCEDSGMVQRYAAERASGPFAAKLQTATEPEKHASATPARLPLATPARALGQTEMHPEAIRPRNGVPAMPFSALPTPAAGTPATADEPAAPSPGSLSGIRPAQHLPTVLSVSATKPMARAEVPAAPPVTAVRTRTPVAGISPVTAPVSSVPMTPPATPRDGAAGQAEVAPAESRSARVRGGVAGPTVPTVPESQRAPAPAFPDSPRLTAPTIPESSPAPVPVPVPVPVPAPEVSRTLQDLRGPAAAPEDVETRVRPVAASPGAGPVPLPVSKGERDDGKLPAAGTVGSQPRKAGAAIAEGTLEDSFEPMAEARKVLTAGRAGDAGREVTRSAVVDRSDSADAGVLARMRPAQPGSGMIPEFRGGIPAMTPPAEESQARLDRTGANAGHRSQASDVTPVSTEPARLFPTAGTVPMPMAGVRTESAPSPDLARVIPLAREVQSTPASASLRLTPVPDGAAMGARQTSPLPTPGLIPSGPIPDATVSPAPGAAPPVAPLAPPPLPSARGNDGIGVPRPTLASAPGTGSYEPAPTPRPEPIRTALAPIPGADRGKAKPHSAPAGPRIPAPEMMPARTEPALPRPALRSAVDDRADPSAPIDVRKHALPPVPASTERPAAPPAAKAGPVPGPAPKTEAGLAGRLSAEDDPLLSGESRFRAEPMAPVRATASAPAHPVAAEHGASPVRQISAAVQGSADRSFEILLNPAELGKVRIQMTPSDGGIIVSIQADRPETLDLLRRHADMLAQDFRSIGYGTAEFSFGQGNRGHPFSAQADFSGEGPGETADPGAESPAETAQRPLVGSPADRIDIRL